MRQLSKPISQVVNVLEKQLLLDSSVHMYLEPFHFHHFSLISFCFHLFCKTLTTHNCPYIFMQLWVIKLTEVS